MYVHTLCVSGCSSAIGCGCRPSFTMHATLKHIHMYVHACTCMCYTHTNTHMMLFTCTHTRTASHLLECAAHYEGGDIIGMGLPLLEREGCVSSRKLIMLHHLNSINTFVETLSALQV